MKEARSLHLRQQLGGWGHWRAHLIKFAIFLAAGALILLRIRDVPPGSRIWVVLLIIVIWVIIFRSNPTSRRKKGKPVRAEASEQGIVFADDNSRSEILWSDFSWCLESPNLFVLLNRSKSILYALPKRAFPDEKSRDWFRATANQPRQISGPADPTFVSGDGIALTLQFKYRDYLSRYITSWRLKGMMLFLFALITVLCLFQTTRPPSDAVNPPFTVFWMTTSILAVMVLMVLLLISFVTWRVERNSLGPQHLLLTTEGIQFTSRDARGRLGWNTYEYYHEGRWGFFVWHPRSSRWFMFPKRAFGSPSDLEQFRTLLQANLKPSRFFYL